MDTALYIAFVVVELILLVVGSVYLSFPPRLRKT